MVAVPSDTINLPISAAFQDETLQWADKDAGDTVPRTFNAADYLAKTNDTIVGTPTITVSPSDLVFIFSSQTAYSCTWMASAGTVNNPETIYAIDVTFNTASGQTIHRRCWMGVQELSPLTDSSDSIVGITQAQLDNEVGNEATRAGNAEQGLQNQITALVTALASYVTPTQLSAAIAAEAALRIQADQANTSLINAETNRATGVESQLQQEINGIQAGGGGGGGGGSGGTLTLPKNAFALGTDGNGNPLAYTKGPGVAAAGGALEATRSGFAPVNTKFILPSLPNAALPQILAVSPVLAGEAATYPANLVGSPYAALTGPAAPYVILLQQNGVTVATISFAQNGTVATITSAGFTTAVGDVLTWVGQAVPDGTMAYLILTLVGIAV